MPPLDDDTGNAERTDDEINAAVEEGISDVLDGKTDDTESSTNDDDAVALKSEDNDDKSGYEDDQSAAGSEGSTGDEGASSAGSDASTDDGAGVDASSKEGGDDNKSGRKPDSDAEGASDDKGSTELDYSMPEGLSERGQERFTKLVDANKEKDTTIEQMTTTIQGMHQLVRSTGMSNEDFLQAVDTISLVNRDPAAGIKALQQTIMNVAKQHSLEVDPLEFDVLDDHPDLKRQVEDMEMTRTNAVELARRRTQEKIDQDRADADKKRQDDETAFNDARDAVIPKLAAFIENIQKNDIDYDAKHDLLLEASQRISREKHPSEWIDAMQQEYDYISKVATKVSGQSKAGGQDNQPIMGNKSVRGGQKEPDNIGQWIDQNL